MKLIVINYTGEEVVSIGDMVQLIPGENLLLEFRYNEIKDTETFKALSDFITVSEKILELPDTSSLKKK